MERFGFEWYRSTRKSSVVWNERCRFWRYWSWSSTCFWERSCQITLNYDGWVSSRNFDHSVNPILCWKPLLRTQNFWKRGKRRPRIITNSAIPNFYFVFAKLSDAFFSHNPFWHKRQLYALIFWNCKCLFIERAMDIASLRSKGRHSIARNKTFSLTPSWLFRLFLSYDSSRLLIWESVLPFWDLTSQTLTFIFLWKWLWPRL